jgi:hypothetical protein
LFISSISIATDSGKCAAASLYDRVMTNEPRRVSNGKGANHATSLKASLVINTQSNANCMKYSAATILL